MKKKLIEIRADEEMEKNVKKRRSDKKSYRQALEAIEEIDETTISSNAAADSLPPPKGDDEKTDKVVTVVSLEDAALLNCSRNRSDATPLELLHHRPFRWAIVHISSPT